MFGRAGRPRVRQARLRLCAGSRRRRENPAFKDRLNQIPESTKDPLLIKAAQKARKADAHAPQDRAVLGSLFTSRSSRPRRPASSLARAISPGGCWPTCSKFRPTSNSCAVVRKRLMDAPRIEAGQKSLTRMLVTLWAGGYVRLDPLPPKPEDEKTNAAQAPQSDRPAAEPKMLGSFGSILMQARRGTPAGGAKVERGKADDGPGGKQHEEGAESGREIYQPRFAYPTPDLDNLLVFRSVNPLYGAFLVKHLGIADRDERVQALESVLEVPTSILRDVRVPRMRDLPPGPLATTRLDAILMERGLVTAEQLRDKSEDEGLNWEERWTPSLAEKLRMLFDSEFPAVHDLVTTPYGLSEKPCGTPAISTS